MVEAEIKKEAAIFVHKFLPQTASRPPTWHKDSNTHALVFSAEHWESVIKTQFL